MTTRIAKHVKGMRVRKVWSASAGYNTQTCRAQAAAMLLTQPAFLLLKKCLALPGCNVWTELTASLMFDSSYCQVSTSRNIS